MLEKVKSTIMCWEDGKRQVLVALLQNWVMIDASGCDSQLRKPSIVANSKTVTGCILSPGKRKR